ncbi:histidine kinase/DNA gyrase B/HSP90-like ATPase [Sphingomonas sp. F9_3S_D5_B_2]
MRYVQNPPDACALMTSARSFGNYDLASALADLIDNSIKAKAKVVDLTCLYNAADPIVRIADDGDGMTQGELHAAMRPASSNPSDERSPDDLGRFGWGMKTASFSQCKRLTVVSQKNGKLSGATWDLDDVDAWKMGVLEVADITELASAQVQKKHGTEVIWTSCDRLSENGNLAESAFNDLIVHARNRLSLVFHRYLAGEVRGRKLAIRLNGTPLSPFDPFHRSNNATQPLEIQEVAVRGKGRIRIEPFILPHYSKLGAGDYERLAGAEGFVRNQGFYVYRNHRLIINGTWFRLMRHGELSQLVRISIDIPNSLDELWKITVDKADAQLPTALRNRLRTIVEGLRKSSGKVFRSKGGKISSANKIAVWSKYARGGEIRYYINREHPLVAALLDLPEDDLSGAALAAISAIEQNFPVVNFGQDVVANPDGLHQAESDPRKLLDQLDAALPLLLANAGGSFENLVKILKFTQPFSEAWPMVSEHLKSKGWLGG